MKMKKPVVMEYEDVIARAREIDLLKLKIMDLMTELKNAPERK